MPPEDGAGSRPPEAGGAGWRIPFWALQVLELGVAFLLVTQSVHVAHGAILVVGGLVIALLALTADGPLGVFRVVGQRLHVVLVAGTSIALAALSVVPPLRPDAEGLVVIAGAVVALVFLATRTVTASGRRGRPARRPGPVIDATATVVPRGTAADGPDNAAAPAADGPDNAVRRAGRTAGAAAAAGRRAVDGHRPQVEDRVRRTLRGAGRLAGRLAGPKGSPADPPS